MFLNLHVYLQNKKHVYCFFHYFCIIIFKIMNTKLTLTIEQTIIEKAKNYARNRNRSLSDLIENYLKALTQDDLQKDEEKISNIQSMKGTFKIPKDFDYKKEISNRLSEKYL